MLRIRMMGWKIASILLICLVAVVHRNQLPVLATKVMMVVLFGTIGYRFDRGIAPYARPDNPDLTALERAVAGIRRAIIVAAFVFAGAMGA